MTLVQNEKKKYNIFVDIDKNRFNIESFENLFMKNSNQLFHKLPSFMFVKEFINKLLGIELNNNIYFEFSKLYLINNKINEKIILLIPELKSIYLHCKHKKYLEDLHEKKIITILRQLLRPYHYLIKTKEKYKNGKKYLLYILQKNKILLDEKNNKNYIINFD